MSDDLHTRAERCAQSAENLSAFSGLKLSHVRREVTTILDLIGRNGFFFEYTRHDISHIDRMLESIEWLIPESTWKRLTPADALLQVLSVYFHDLGMLITEEEYETRDTSVIDSFREALFATTHGDDYRAKIEALGPDKADRFVYQEFVRAHHGERVRAWISGNAPTRLGSASQAVHEIGQLLAPLSAAFRDDLGLVCESHHLDDLDRTDKYVISRPYGPTDEETANVQYAAIILRTADLLHITSDRTPSVMFRLIAPTDPISQQEWAKQSAVASVRAKPGRDRDGNVDLSAPRDTVEVFAEFTDESGFFGLTSYLSYAAKQLQRSFEWAAVSRKRHGATFEFPWRYIDDSHIATKGFLRDTYEFSVDQARVLDLLTGHTLYNNTNVVLRELVQNSLDAIRLAEVEAGGSYAGRVEVAWDSKRRRLAVKDNGTGMTQDVIERHLLRVGSSRYQDPEFRRKYPSFSAISRFGIGVLSTFMIADTVTVTTAHPEESEARRLSLRSVHGRYLIRLLDKDVDDDARRVAPHGTEVELVLRPSARLEDVVDTLRHWVVVPRCDVTVTVDDAEPIHIGYASVADALSAWLAERGLDREKRDDGSARIRVEQRDHAGISIAYALRWSDHFTEWQFVPVGRGNRDTATSSLGLCVEGVRVAEGSPGYNGDVIASLADATGPQAPKTDVARAQLERTAELVQTLREIYSAYCGVVAREVHELTTRRGFSLTWAAQEARWLMMALLREPMDGPLLVDVASRVPLLVLDDGDARRLVSPGELSQIQRFWTVHSAFFRSAEALLREMPTRASVAALSRALKMTEFQPPEGPVLALGGWRDPITRVAFRGKEVATISIRRSERRVDLGWEEEGDRPRWVTLRPRVMRYPEVSELLSTRRASVGEMRLPVKDIAIEGRINDAVLNVDGVRYLLPDTPLTTFLSDVISRIGDDDSREADIVRAYLDVAIGETLMALHRDRRIAPADLRDYLESIGGVVGRIELRSLVDRFTSFDEIAHTLLAGPLEVFDPDAWERSTGDPFT